MAGRRARIGRSLGVFAAVARNPGLRRAVLAYAAFITGEWATWIAILVYAYGRGGAAEAGLVVLVQIVPAAIVAPLAATVADRIRRERALLASYLVQFVAMAATAMALAADGPAVVVYALAALTTTTVALTRPAHGALLPSLAQSPDELAAANVASGIVQSLCILVAPAVAGLLLEAHGPASVFALTAGTALLAVLLVASIRTVDDGLALEPLGPEHDGGRLVGGFGAIMRLGASRPVVTLMGAAAILEGAVDVLVVVLAVDVLVLGDSAVGFFNSAIGAGGLAGTAVAVAIVGRTRLARPFAAGLLLAGLPLAAAGLLPTPAVVLLLLAAAGAGRTLTDVSGRTLLQRITPERTLGRVLGVLEALHMAFLGIGAIAVPALVAAIGPRGAFIALGLWVPLVMLVTWRSVRTADAAGRLHVRGLELLRGLGTFGLLAPPTIERLAARLVPVHAADGAWIIRQGERGDRFYIVDAGVVDVFVDDRFIRTQGPGEAFGDLALLRDIPRTASVRARGDVAAYALERDVFLSAVAGHPGGRTTALQDADLRVSAAWE